MSDFVFRGVLYGTPLMSLTSFIELSPGFFPNAHGGHCRYKTPLADFIPDMKRDQFVSLRGPVRHHCHGKYDNYMKMLRDLSGLFTLTNNLKLCKCKQMNQQKSLSIQFLLIQGPHKM